METQASHEPRFFDGTPALVQEEIAKIVEEIAEADRSAISADAEVLKAEEVVKSAKTTLRLFEQRATTSGNDTRRSLVEQELRKLHSKVTLAEGNREVYAAEAYTGHLHRSTKRATLEKLQKKLRLLRYIELNPTRAAQNRCFSAANILLMSQNTNIIDSQIPSTRIEQGRMRDVQNRNTNSTGQNRLCLQCGRRYDRNGRQLYLYHGPDGMRTLCGTCSPSCTNR